MCKEAGEPKSSDTKHINPAEFQDVDIADDADSIFDEQDEDTYKILAILNQQLLRDTFGDDDLASDLEDDTPEFSQAFMDNMRTMVEEHFGPDAAERFMALNNQKDNNIHHQPQDVSESEKAMSQAITRTVSEDEPLDACRPSKKRFSDIRHYLSTWPRRVAAIFIIALLILGGYQVTVRAFKLPMVNFQPEIMEEYSKVGTLEDIIYNLDTTDYPKTLEHIYEPSIVADGYEEVERDITSKFVDIYYENVSGQKYQYFQSTIDSNTFIDTESDSGKVIMINDSPAFLVEANDGMSLWWFDYQYTYQLVGDLTEEQILSIAESLCEIDD